MVLVGHSNCVDTIQGKNDVLFGVHTISMEYFTINLYLDTNKLKNDLISALLWPEHQYGTRFFISISMDNDGREITVSESD